MMIPQVTGKFFLQPYLVAFLLHELSASKTKVEGSLSHNGKFEYKRKISKIAFIKCSDNE